MAVVPCLHHSRASAAAPHRQPQACFFTRNSYLAGNRTRGTATALAPIGSRVDAHRPDGISHADPVQLHIHDLAISRDLKRRLPGDYSAGHTASTSEIPLVRSPSRICMQALLFRVFARATASWLGHITAQFAILRSLSWQTNGHPALSPALCINEHVLRTRQSEVYSTVHVSVFMYVCAPHKLAVQPAAQIRGTSVFNRT
ncbi:hypothetical protein FN846DRAFT_571859 [Sphaerosporella brunnea]|uniref:Uncharacterized protein n=1 Tax=Sphaerosporella brunnea TaxID=1250544 RepID=A0A5J5ED06_9PEZI|nr:hypothetical protein FN846DRAFT_571859 [Sphaerosporella brunnea]